MKIVPLSSLRDNYIWAACQDDTCVIVDPGESAPVETFLARSGLTLAAILLTHRHHDHVGGVSDLLHTHAVPVFGPRSAQMPQVTHPVGDGDRFRCQGFGGEFEVLGIPGHTEEHLAYRLANALFCGDTLFGAGCGRLMGGTPAQFHASLQRLAKLPADTQVYCAHEYTLANLRFAQAVEPQNTAVVQRQEKCAALRAQGHPTLPTTLADELKTNPFLRVDQPAVRAQAALHHAGPLATDEAVFLALRAWKDQF